MLTYHPSQMESLRCLLLDRRWYQPHQRHWTEQLFIHVVAGLLLPLALSPGPRRCPDRYHEWVLCLLRDRYEETDESSTVFQLDRQQGKIIWECNNGGQLWGQSVADGYGNSASMPAGVCSCGFHSLYIAFVLCLLADFAFQSYA